MLQDTCKRLIKGKGTGAKMGKHLGVDDLALLNSVFLSEDVSLTSKATLLTAILMLPATKEEAEWLTQFRLEYRSILPNELHFLLDLESDMLPDDAGFVSTVVLGNDLTYAQAVDAFKTVLDPDFPEYLKAVFLEAERLKEESSDENKACLDVFRQAGLHEAVDVPVLLDLSVAYDGFNRTPCVWWAVAPILAALDVSVVLHGAAGIGPKFGVCVHDLLLEAGARPDLTMAEAKAALEAKDIGFAYIDQSVSFPALFALRNLRKDMVKRPVIATVEKLLCPFRATGQNWMMSGYTHPPYKVKQQGLMAQLDLDRFFLVRGQEGSIQLPTDRRAPGVYFDGKENKEVYLRPEPFGCETEKSLPNPDLTVADSLSSVEATLRGETITSGVIITYLAAQILTTLGGRTPEDAIQAVKSVISSGEALARWQRYIAY